MVSRSTTPTILDAGVPSFGAKIGVTIASPVFVFIWRQLDLFVSEEPDMVAIGVKFRELLAAYGAKQLIPPERPRLLIQREKAPPPVSPTKEQIEPLLRAGMSAGEIAKQLVWLPTSFRNALCRKWPEFRGSIKRIRESLATSRSAKTNS